MEKTPRITEAQARDVVERCLKVLYYRDARAYDKVMLYYLIFFLNLKANYLEVN